jgi:putative flippase GtrA
LDGLKLYTHRESKDARLWPETIVNTTRLERAIEYGSKHQTKIRFLIVGGINTLFGWSAFPAIYFLTLAARWHYLIVLVITQVICITFSFLTAKFFVFRTRGNFVAEFAKFCTFHASYFALNIIILPILVEVVKINPVIGQFGFAVAVVLSSYFWHSKITFKQPGAAS